MAEERIESYPFDSNPPTEFDDYGRPIYDRAVGAHMLRYTYRQFFSDGVFGTPADALQIGKGDGLSVTIQPGMWIIEGAIGAVGFDTGEAKVVKLSDAAPQGKVTYGIFLRFDDNDGRRSMYLVVRAGEAGGTVPSVETAPAVSELRLGYVTVPSGATDLADATIIMEKGTDVCPYAAPFEEIDLSQVVADAQNQAQEATDAFLIYAKTYYDLVASALDGTTAGELQAQIDAITPAGLVDDVTLGQSSSGKMQVKTGGVGTSQLADGGVTYGKLAADMQASVPATLGAAGTILKSDGASAKWAEQSLDLVTLWEGTWTQGSIEVPGVSEYTVIVVTTGTGSKVIAMRGDDDYYGASGYFKSSSEYGACSVFFSVSGDTLSAANASATGKYNQAAAICIYRDYSSSTMNGYRESITKIEGWLK